MFGFGLDMFARHAIHWWGFIENLWHFIGVLCAEKEGHHCP